MYLGNCLNGCILVFCQYLYRNGECQGPVMTWFLEAALSRRESSDTVVTAAGGGLDLSQPWPPCVAPRVNAPNGNDDSSH